MQELERLKKVILEEYPRLTEESEFSFRCHPGIPCFNACCADINIFLTPYDIIRLKNRLGITSGEFLSRYTISPFDEKTKYPIILLKMNEDKKKTCPFVTAEGCSVYEDRPWPCRMYPLGLASRKEQPDQAEKEFYFILKEDLCLGHSEKQKLTVKQWLDNQGINEYNLVGEWFKDITLHDYFEKGGQLDPGKMEMFFTACYNIDKFRDFIFNSSFLDKFEVEQDTLEKIKQDDIDLLKFAYNWLRFALFGEQTMKIRSDILDAKKKEMAQKKKK